MIPTTYRQRHQTSHDVRYNIEGVELSPVGECSLYHLRADSEDGGAGCEGEVKSAAPRGIHDPVECGGEDEEYDEVEDFVVRVGD